MQFKKLLLAVDAFTDEPEIGGERIARSVKALVKDREVNVEVVYVMTPNGLGLASERFHEYENHYSEVAKQVLLTVTDAFDKNVTTKITVLPVESNSLRVAVERFLELVSTHGTDLIALSTHGRKGVDRFFLGSFAESLLLRIPVPLLITNSKTPWDPAFHHILFATDFEEGFHEAFDATISFAKDLGARVTLFHRVDPERFIPGPPGFIAVQEWKNRKIDRQMKALQLKEKAEQQGVRVDVEIDLENHRVTPAILSAAEKLKVSLIAISARKSAKLFALGSIPRQIVREASCPVLVLPLECKTEVR